MAIRLVMMQMIRIMNQEQPLVNRVANSGLITIDLEKFFPEHEIAQFDLKDFLFMELILKEKDFRAALKEHHWEQYKGKVLTVFCSADAIIPMWAYMLVAASATPFAEATFQGTPDDYLRFAYAKMLDNLDVGPYEQQRIVIKGCSDKAVPAAAYVALTQKLQPVAKSIMFGEPCSTVPVFKKK